jgi:hypothetical protein
MILGFIKTTVGFIAMWVIMIATMAVMLGAIIYGAYKFLKHNGNGYSPYN